MPPIASNASRRAIRHAPETQSTSIGPVPSSRPGRLRRDSGFPGSTRVSHELRPAMPVVRSGNLPGRRLDRPVGVVDARAGGADVGMRAHPRQRASSHVAGCDDAVGIEQQDERGAVRLAGAAVDAGGESLVGGDRAAAALRETPR